MQNIQLFFNDLYNNFNQRNIDVVVSNMTNDVKWANGMNGGFVYGRDGVKKYWSIQFTMISSNVTPVEVNMHDDTAKIKVRQVVHNLDGKLLSNEYVNHFYRFKNNKIAEFTIGEKTQQ